MASDFFDPGLGVDEFGARGPRLSFVAHGQSLLGYGLNLDDVSHENAPGAVKTIVATPGDPTSAGLGGLRSLDGTELFDHDPAGHDAAAALPDAGVLAVNPDGLTYTGPATYYYLSVGDGCLDVAGFVGVPSRVGGGLSAEGTNEVQGATVAVPAGNWTLTLHPDTGVRDGFHCDNPPAAAGTPLVIANGQRAFLLLYRTPGDAQLRVVLLQFGS